jgi:hypothetical protein
LLHILEKLIQFGFFLKDEEHILPILYNILDGRNDIGSEESDTRYEQDEHTLHCMKIKLQICRIIHIFFDVHLETRTVHRLTAFKDKFEDAENNIIKDTSSDKHEKEHHKHHHLHHHHHKDEKENENDIPLISLSSSGTKGHQKEQQNDKWLVDVLIDLILYEYEPLTTSALGLLFRFMRFVFIMLCFLFSLDLMTKLYQP